MGLADDLLILAGHLANPSTNHPEQAWLRRSVSTSYYALFHLLVGDAVQCWNGTSDARLGLERAFGHDSMYKVSNAVWQGSWKGWSDPSPPIPAELKFVAEAFVSLQQARHQADYNNAKAWTQTAARETSLRSLKLLSSIGERFKPATPLTNTRFPFWPAGNAIDTRSLPADRTPNFPPQITSAADSYDNRVMGAGRSSGRLNFERESVGSENLDFLMSIVRQLPKRDIEALVQFYLNQESIAGGAAETRAFSKQPAGLNPILLAHAVETFGSERAAKTWLSSECGALNNRTPLEVIQSDGDEAEVERILDCIDYGMLA